MIRSNGPSLKALLARKNGSIGSWVTLGHPAVAEIMAGAGFDWLVIDMEHSAITFHQAQQLIQVIELSGVPPLVRVGENNPNLIKRAMDCGAHGVIVPMVNTKAEALQAVRSVKYPPVGSRGVGLARAQGYGMSFEPYRDWAAKESVVIVQIEHIDAVRNLEDILDVPGLDAIFVGPYDLSGSMGKPGEFHDPDVEAAISRTLKLATQRGISAGFHVIAPEVEALRGRSSQGYRFLAFSLDTLFLARSCAGLLSQARGDRRPRRGG